MLIAVLLASFTRSTTGDPALTFCCAPDNNLYQAVSTNDHRFQRYASIDEAIDHAAPGSGLLILTGDRESSSQVQAAAAKRLKTYIEVPPAPGDPNVKKLQWERVVVTSDLFGPELPKGRILSIGQQSISVRQASNPLLVVGRVAGFDTLAFGMPKKSDPLLWQADSQTLLSSARLSSFSTARFAPGNAWRPVWRTILNWLGAKQVAAQFAWSPEVSPTYAANAPLPKGFELIAQRRGAAWFAHARLLVDPSALSTYCQADRWPDRVGPAPTINGDGRFGMLEGYSSAIDDKGDQPARWYRRADCNSESAMALALAGDARERQIGENLADFIALKSKVVHNDPSKASYGLAGWNDLPSNVGTFYGDDNARYILGLIGAAGALKTNRWDDQILKCIVGNFRTTGVNGFRGNALSEGDIERLGWRQFYDASTVNMAPHFEAYAWACYLWAYSKTGYRPLLERTEKAIDQTMMAGEKSWTWTNGLQQERARMLLPLSWLVRVDDTPQHRAWLDEMTRKVIGYQVKCGAIREELGDLSRGIAGPPQSNEAYGTAETPMIQENGDPLADMLYTSNFAFLGLHEAAAVTKNPVLARAEGKLAEFLCRIQIQSKTHPEFDGAWFRAFDFGDWDYWASNSDLGWGAWSIESGWSVSWITSVLALRQRHEAFWNVDSGFKVDKSVLKLMLP